MDTNNRRYAENCRDINKSTDARYRRDACRSNNRRDAINRRGDYNSRDYYNNRDMNYI
jgi:hypothetical protein